MKIRPAKLFQDSMLLQQGCPVSVWGTGEAGTEIHLAVQNQTAETRISG